VYFHQLGIAALIDQESHKALFISEDNHSSVPMRYKSKSDKTADHPPD
jgi:hypothetical protein